MAWKTKCNGGRTWQGIQKQYTAPPSPHTVTDSGPMDKQATGHNDPQWNTKITMGATCHTFHQRITSTKVRLDKVTIQLHRLGVDTNEHNGDWKEKLHCVLQPCVATLPPQNAQTRQNWVTTMPDVRYGTWDSPTFFHVPKLWHQQQKITKNRSSTSLEK